MSEFFRLCGNFSNHVPFPRRNFSHHVRIFPTMLEFFPIPILYAGKIPSLLMEEIPGLSDAKKRWGNHPSYVRPYSARVQKHFPFFTVQCHGRGVYSSFLNPFISSGSLFTLQSFYQGESVKRAYDSYFNNFNTTCPAALPHNISRGHCLPCKIYCLVLPCIKVIIHLRPLSFYHNIANREQACKFTDFSQ